MLTKTEKSFNILFFIIVIVELFSGSKESLVQFHYFAKPAILIALIIFFWKQSHHLNKYAKNITLLALTLSLLGDVLLMFTDKSPNYFIGGLLAFLLAHLMYISVFLKSRNKNANPFSIIVVLLIYASGLFYLIKDGLGEMLIPVLLYLIVILTMTITAFLRKRLAPSNSYNLVLAGAIFFMISDSLLALNKFYETLPLSNLSIMLTYALAQYLIVSGILKQKH